MKAIWIVKAGTTFADTARRHGDFEQWTQAALQLGRHPVRVLDVQGGHVLPDPSECSGVVVTGSHAMVTDAEPWSVPLQQWIPRLLDATVPFLGICYGHQLLAQSMGGRVDYHPRGREVGTVEIDLLEACRDDPLFSAAPSKLLAHTVHAQSVSQLPRGAVRLACNAFEPNHAFRMGEAAWGVQFHPEYSADIMRSYIEHLAPACLVERLDVSSLLDSVRNTPDATQIMSHFGRLVEGNG